MRAAFYRRYGGPDVLELGERPAPSPGRGEVLLDVVATSLNPKDVLLRRGKLRLFARGGLPRVPGYDVAGTVAALGPGATGVRVGDRVFGLIDAWRGGGCAAQVALPARAVAPAPASIELARAAAVPLAASTALQALRDLLRVGPGERVCVHGASGGVGLFAVQIARLLGAHVTATCSARNAALVAAHGADEVLAYDQVDAVADGRRYHAFFDVFGNRPYPRVRHALGARGRHVTTVPSPAAIARELLARAGGPPARLVAVRSRRPDLAQLAAWIDGGQLVPVIDRVVALDDVRAAHAYLETKRARGKVVIELIRNRADTESS